MWIINITSDLQGGRLPEVIDAGDPAVMISHWQGFYGIHNEDRRGFRAFQTIVRRLKERDPHNEKSQWRKCSEITNYAIAREMADVAVEEQIITLDLPVQVPEFTLRLREVAVTGAKINGKPLTPAPTKSAFRDGTFYRDGDITLLAFTPEDRNVRVEIESH